MHEYNNSVGLFSNEAAKGRYRSLRISEDGHIWAGAEDGYIARCQDKAEAESILTQSGYVNNGGVWEVAELGSN